MSENIYYTKKSEETDFKWKVWKGRSCPSENVAKESIGLLVNCKENWKAKGGIGWMISICRFVEARPSSM